MGMQVAERRLEQAPDTYRDVGVPSGRIQDILSIAATGILGGLFPTPLYRLRPVGVPSRRIQDILSINEGRRLHGCGR